MANAPQYPTAPQVNANRQAKSKANGANMGFEEKLWQTADKLRCHPDLAKYEPVVLSGPLGRRIFGETA
jgi:hypothetical protein